jgi:membrane protein YdbS with pleckstrin-like domain
MTYKASFDTTVKVLSTLITGAIAVIAVSYLINIFQAAVQGVAISAYAGKIILVSLLVGLVLFVFLFSVKNYTIENNSLHINRWLNKVIIPFAEIKTVRVVTDADMGLVFRTFGVGGLFGYLGKFSSSKLGSLTYYATQNKNRVFIELHNGKKLLITPDDLVLAEQLNAK